MTGVDLGAIDGLGANTVLAVLSETGPDLSRFPTEKHFASWTGLAPRRDQSGKRSRNVAPPGVGAGRVGNAFRMAAQSLRHRQTVLGSFLRRLKSRLGPGVAIRATACKLAKLFWRLLTLRTQYAPLKLEEYEARFQPRRQRGLTAQAAALGLALIPLPAAEAAASPVAAPTPTPVVAAPTPASAAAPNKRRALTRKPNPGAAP